MAWSSWGRVTGFGGNRFDCCSGQFVCFGWSKDTMNEVTLASLMSFGWLLLSPVTTKTHHTLHYNTHTHHTTTVSWPSINNGGPNILILPIKRSKDENERLVYFKTNNVKRMWFFFFCFKIVFIDGLLIMFMLRVKMYDI